MDLVLKLLTYWKEYLEKGVGNNLGRFGLWLNEQLTEYAEVPTQKVPDQFDISTNFAFGYLFGNLAAYADHWTKLTFRNLPLQNHHDFGILKFIELSGHPTKKEVATDSTLEQSTCFEAIKRLVKNNLLQEESDTKDKRVKRVKLTDYGIEVIQLASQQASHQANLLVGDLTEEEKNEAIGLLKKLNDFHEDLYKNSSKEKIIESFEL